MASVRERILQAVEAALNATGKPVELTVFRHRTLPLEDEDLPAAVVLLGRETVTLSTSAPVTVTRTLPIRVEVSALGEPADAVLDPYLVWVVRALMREPTFGGLVQALTETGSAWRAEASDDPMAEGAVAFEIAYETLETDPEAQP